MTLTSRIKRANRPLNKIISRITRARESHTTQSPSTDTDIDHSKVLHILADDRRRYALEYLAAQPTGETVSLSDLAEVVAARENDCSIQAVTSSQRERVYIALYQQHYQVLSEIVEIDSDRKTFTPTAATKRAWAAYTAFCTELAG